MLSTVCVGLKTHSKITLVVRREETGIRRYVHLATGNYNDSTAKLYTDCGILTCDERFGEDATAVFNMLSGYSEPKKWNRLIVAPIWMKNRFVQMIEERSGACKTGKTGRDHCKDEFTCVILRSLQHFIMHLPVVCRSICLSVESAA